MKNKIILISSLAVFLLIISCAFAMGIGLGPNEIKISNAFKGEEYERIITVYNLYETKMMFLLSSEEEMNDWIYFYDDKVLITNITIPPDSNKVITVVFKIPEDAANGIYTSKIYVQSVPGGETEGSQTISMMSSANLEINITGEQNLFGVVKSVGARDTEINRPLKLTVQFQNTGNVVARPLIQVLITKNDNSIDNIIYEEKSVKTGSTEIIEFEWNTTGQTVGDYIANVKVLLGNEILSQKDLNFKILDRGTLTARGYITNVEAPQQMVSEGISKIEVGFMNIGEIDMIAKISGEVYLDKNIVDTLESDETLIKIGKTETLTAYFKPSKDGNYLIKSNIVYEGKKEPMSEISINVGTSNIESPILGMFIFDTQSLIIILFIIFAFCLILIGLFKKSTKRK